MSDDPLKDMKKSLKRAKYCLHSIGDFVRVVFNPRYRKDNVRLIIGQNVGKNRVKYKKASKNMSIKNFNIEV